MTTKPTSSGGAGQSLQVARVARARMSALVDRVHAGRPRAGAPAGQRAAWLAAKADVHDQIAGYLRRIGDVPGAVEAEVLAARARIDATDLATTPVITGTGESTSPYLDRTPAAKAGHQDSDRVHVCDDPPWTALTAPAPLGNPLPFLPLPCS